ncbi:MAG: alpha/beta hydrolase [Pedobacter sp.]|uniref:alpha/beta hydrolase fold domain-containing protein n=1 Tax=Pedobacter sp. TaxID=1411316 RepID=UPI00339A158B
MKRYSILILGLIYSVFAKGQSTQWLTGIRDTSYSSAGDYRNNLKNYPFIKLVMPQKFANVKEKPGLVYAKTGERELHLDAFLPGDKKGGKTPAILIVHGGGWRSGDRSQHIPLAQHLADKGIAAFTVEYRLSTEALYPNAVFDVKAAVRWLKANAKSLNVDTGKVALLGFSAGGQLAALAGVTSAVKKLEGDFGNVGYSSKVNAVIDIDGTLSFVHPDSWETQNPGTFGASGMWFGYPRTERIDLWTEASPFTYAGQNTTPFLFLNSSVVRMHAGRDDWKKQMDQKGVYTEIVNFKDSPHSFCLYEPWFDPMLGNITAFIAKVFK